MAPGAPDEIRGAAGEVANVAAAQQHDGAVEHAGERFEIGHRRRSDYL